MDKRESFQITEDAVNHSSGEFLGPIGEHAWEYGYAHGLRKGYEIAMKAFSSGIQQFGLDYNDAQSEHRPF